MEQDILGFNVAMDYRMTMSVVERACDLARDANRIRNRELSLAPKSVAKRLTLDQRHDIEEEAVCLARIEELQNMRVLEIGSGLDLGQEPLGAHDSSQLRSKHFEG